MDKLEKDMIAIWQQNQQVQAWKVAKLRSEIDLPAATLGDVTNEELEELEGNLAQSVRANQDFRLFIERRINWAES